MTGCKRWDDGEGAVEQSNKHGEKLHPFDAWLDRTRPAWREKNQGSVNYYAMRAAWLESSFTLPPGYTLVESIFFDTIIKQLSPPQIKSVCEEEGKRYFTAKDT